MVRFKSDFVSQDNKVLSYLKLFVYLALVSVSCLLVAIVKRSGTISRWDTRQDICITLF